MSVVDSAPEGGKFRAFAAAGLDGTAGAWGIGNLLGVRVDASGTISLGGASTTVGVILTTEGKRDSTHANYKKVVGGSRYTVMRRAIFTECDQWASPALTAGDVLYAAANGDVTTTPSDEAVLLGYAVKGQGTGGLMFVLDVGSAAPAGTLAPEDLKYAVVNGAVAGNVTVTGITTSDDLLLVAALSKAVIEATTVAGAAAGDVTVTGIATTDELIAVLRLGPAVFANFTKLGAAAGDHTITGIATADTLVSVIYLNFAGTVAVVGNLTAEFTITAADTINNAGGTDTTGGVLIVTYRDATSDTTADLTSEFTITAADTINNAGGTSSAGSRLLVLYRDALSDEVANLTAEFTITGANTINNAGGTSSLGSELLIAYATP
jgi:hypothetical protein